MSLELLSRRRFLQVSALGAAGALAACTPPVTPEVVAPTPETEAPAAPMTEAEIFGDDLPGSPDKPKGWRTQIPKAPAGYPKKPPMVITSNRLVDGTSTWAMGDTVDNTVGTRFIKKALGIEWELAFVNDWDTRTEKFNLAMAAGTLPDFCELIGFTTFSQLTEADMIEDITDAYATEASEEWVKGPLGDFAGEELAFAFVTVNGRKMGLPQTMVAAQDDQYMFYRQDWFDKLGLDVPTDLNELKEVSLALKEADLGMGAAGTTRPLMFSESGINYGMAWYGSAQPIFGAHGVIATFWTPDGDGLMVDDIRPEMKDGLAFLAEWYKEGVINEDFFTMGSYDVHRAVEGSQCGLWFGSPGNMTFGPTGAMTNDPEAVFNWADIPAHPETGVKNRGWTNPWVDGCHAFRKGLDPDKIAAVLEQGNFMAELLENPKNRMHGWEGHHYLWEGDAVVSGPATFKGWFGFVGSPGGGGADPARRAKQFKYIEEEWTQVPPEKRDAWMTIQLEDPTGLQQKRRQLYMTAVANTDSGIKDRFTRLPTETMKTMQSELDKLRDETKIGIIKGDLPVDSFDDYVEQWKKLGGQKIIEEVNDWWKSR